MPLTQDDLSPKSLILAHLNNTHELHATINTGKKGDAIALRTGPCMRECEHIIESIKHFYRHMKIECCANMGLCSIEYKEDMKSRKAEIVEFCEHI